MLGTVRVVTSGNLYTGRRTGGTLSCTRPRPPVPSFRKSRRPSPPPPLTRRRRIRRRRRRHPLLDPDRRRSRRPRRQAPSRTRRRTLASHIGRSRPTAPTRKNEPTAPDAGVSRDADDPSTPATSGSPGAVPDGTFAHIPQNEPTARPGRFSDPVNCDSNRTGERPATG
jgi:hypothetical protein